MVLMKRQTTDEQYMLQVCNFMQTITKLKRQHWNLFKTFVYGCRSTASPPPRIKSVARNFLGRWNDGFYYIYLHDMLLKKNTTCFSKRKHHVSIPDESLCYFMTSVFTAITSHQFHVSRTVVSFGIYLPHQSMRFAV
uniref:Uncharacterized protein n=1 Tax=Setaria viridis TaxID=4556 RepID=A0A4U6WCW6_SETVI|nr:hypothetical protein SEVIR_1G239800v2 [Setaria viridis]